MNPLLHNFILGIILACLAPTAQAGITAFKDLASNRFVIVAANNTTLAWSDGPVVFFP